MKVATHLHHSIRWRKRGKILTGNAPEMKMKKEQFICEWYHSTDGDVYGLADPRQIAEKLGFDENTLDEILNDFLSDGMIEFRGIDIHDVRLTPLELIMLRVYARKCSQVNPWYN